MAIDFPASPTPGQVFQGYYWDNVKKAWRSETPSTGAVVTSTTTPTGAKNGDLWYNTNDGTLYVYFDNGITAYWTEIKANSALTTTLNATKANLAGGNTFTGTQTLTNQMIASNSNSTYTTPDPANTDVPEVVVFNTSNSSATAHSVLVARTGGASGGDPFVSFDISGVFGWSAGVDNSDSDSFKVGRSWADVGSNSPLIIDTSGRMRLPYQPSFRCYGTNNYSSGTVIYNQTPIHNEGGHYNNSTGLFTAPITGKYAFSASFFSLISSGGTMGYKINGGGWVALAGREGSEGYYEPYTLTTIVHMNANDYIGCYPYVGTLHLNPALNSFSGHFLG